VSDKWVAFGGAWEVRSEMIHLKKKVGWLFPRQEFQHEPRLLPPGGKPLNEKSPCSSSHAVLQVVRARI